MAATAQATGAEDKSRTFKPWSHMVNLIYAQVTHNIGLNDLCDSSHSIVLIFLGQALFCWTGRLVAREGLGVLVTDPIEGMTHQLRRAGQPELRLDVFAMGFDGLDA
jgi:hypothetical protein